MKITIKKISTLDLMYDLALVIYLILSILDLSVIDISAFFAPLSIIAISLVVVRLLFVREIPKNSLICIFLLGILISIVYFKSGRSWFFPYTAIFILFGYKIDIHHVLKTYFLTETILIAFLSALSLSGIVDDILYYRIDAFTGNLVARHSFGFNNTNTFCFISFQIAVSLLLIFEAKVKRHIIVFFFLWSLFIEYLTRNYTLLIVLLVFAILLWVIKFIERKPVYFLVKLLSITPIVLGTLSMLSTVLYSKTSMKLLALDRFTSSRISLWNTCYKRYGFSLLGKSVEFGTFGTINKVRIVLDNAYLQLAIRYGVISLLIFLIISTILNIWALKNKHYVVYALSIAMQIIGFTETATILICMNSILLFAPISIYSDFYSNKQEESEL